jgi:hypothetical protein
LGYTTGKQSKVGTEVVLCQFGVHYGQTVQGGNGGGVMSVWGTLRVLFSVYNVDDVALTFTGSPRTRIRGGWLPASASSDPFQVSSPLPVPTNGPDVPVNGPDVPMNGPDVPVNGPDVPVDALDVPVDGLAIPVNGPDVPVDGPDISAGGPCSRCLSSR